MATKHKAEHDGITFTRTSAGRVYSHLVLRPTSLADALADAESSARHNWKANQAFNREFVDGTSRFLGPRSWDTTDAQRAEKAAQDAAQVETSKAWLALGESGLIHEYQARALQTWRGHWPDRDAAWYVVGWASRLDLAQKQAKPGDVILPTTIL
jgi:hypothetical protein